MARSFWFALRFLLMLMTPAVFSSAQQFQPVNFYRTGSQNSYPISMIAVDLNNDGNIDFVVGNEFSDGITVLLGNGDGSFTTLHSQFRGAIPTGFASADLNEDGFQDVAFAQSDGVYFLLGNGDGTFHLSPRIGQGNIPINIALADFNGDGHLDLAVADSNSERPQKGGVEVFFGNGDGTFQQPPELVRAGDHPWAITAADLNGDGFVDLVVGDDNNTGSSEDTLFVLLNNGDGTFRQTAVLQTGEETVSVAVADLNHDGKLDLAVASPFNQSVVVLLGNGDGTFTAPVFYSTSSLGNAPTEVVIADFNLDGNQDIATVLVQPNLGFLPVVLLYGNGDGTFQTPFFPAPYTTQLLGSALAVADFDKDGTPDLAFTFNSPASRVGVLLNAQ